MGRIYDSDIIGGGENIHGKIYDSENIGGDGSGGIPEEPQPMAGDVLVNGATFGLDSGFPTTGFIGATFQILLNGDAVNNGNYSWSADQPWVTVDDAGNVSFTETVISETKTVTISATRSGEYYVWSFTVNYWFTNSGPIKMSWPDANDFASTRGGLPASSSLTNDGFSGANPSRAIGYLWSEWGALDGYPAGFSNGSYWTSEIGGTGYHDTVNLFNGNLASSPDTLLCYVVLRQEL